MRSIKNDWQFGVAVVAAPIFWLILFAWGRPLVPLDWLVVQPGRFAVVAFVYPVLEEIVFRGGLQPWLQEKIWRRHAIAGVSVANVMTSVIFAGLHFFTHPLVWALLIFVPSLVFGYFRDRHGLLAAPILLHVFYNAGFACLFGM